MTTVHTTGRALADAATLIRKLAGRDAAARLIVTGDGRAIVEAVGHDVGIAEVVGTGTRPDGGRAAYAADLDGWRKLRKAGEVTIRDHGQGATMTVGATSEGVTATITSALDEAGELPAWPAFPGEREPITVDARGPLADGVAASLRSVAEAAARDTYAREVLRSVNLSPGEAAATDSYRLNLGPIPTDPAPGEGHASGLIPAAWVRAIPRRGVERLTIVAEDGAGKDAGACELHMLVRVGRGQTSYLRDVTVEGRTAPGPFPNYGALLPDASDDDVTLILTDELADVLASMTGPTTVEVGGPVGQTVTLTDPSGVRATIGTATVGALDVAVNPDFLADLVDHVGAGTTLRLRDGLRAMVATSEASERTTLLMPMRVPS